LSNLEKTETFTYHPTDDVRHCAHAKPEYEVEVVKTSCARQGGIAEASLLEQADEIRQGATKVKAISAV